MTTPGLESIRDRLNDIDRSLLALLSERSRIVEEIGEDMRVPAAATEGVSGGAALQHLLRQMVQTAPGAQKPEPKKPLLVSRKAQKEDTVVRIGDAAVGGAKPIMIAGPCAVESDEQVRLVAKALQDAGVSVIRGGAFKPRTSPYEFQGLGIEGLKILKEVAGEFGLKTISEIVDPRHIELAAEYIDVIQIGARNMHNFELLKEAGESRTPVLLKRGLAATIDEFLHAAEYIVSRGNTEVMLIERGIRTYEKATRNTLDISAVPILKQESHLPVLVDVTHSTGRKDILVPCAKAALAAGADGIMVEVHPDPAAALSDASQQLNIDEFRRFYAGVKASGLL